MRLKPHRARPARALPVGAQRHICGPLRNNGWVALSVLQKGGEKRLLSRAGRNGRISEWERIPNGSYRWTLGEEAGGPEWNVSLYGVRVASAARHRFANAPPFKRDIHSHSYAMYQSGVAGKALPTVLVQNAKRRFAPKRRCARPHRNPDPN